MKSRLSQFCGIASRLGKFMNFSTARKYYYACIYSVITYCISTWGGVIHLSYRGTCLIRTHERIVNLLFRKFYIDNSECIFKKAGILKISDIHRLYVSIYMYKYRCGVLLLRRQGEKPILGAASQQRLPKCADKNFPWYGATLTGHISKTRADIDMPTTATFIRGPYLSNTVNSFFLNFWSENTIFFYFLGPITRKLGQVSKSGQREVKLGGKKY